MKNVLKYVNNYQNYTFSEKKCISNFYYYLDVCYLKYDHVYQH